MIKTVRTIGLIAALATGCGCGGGSSEQPVDLSGFWKLWQHGADEPDETGPETVYIEQSGHEIDGSEVAGVINGDEFTFIAQGGGFQTTFAGQVHGDSALGTFQVDQPNRSGIFRMERFSPTGDLEVSGSVGGSAVEIDTTTAIGAREFLDVRLTVLDEVEVGFVDSRAEFELEFDPDGLSVGTWQIPQDLRVEVDYDLSGPSTQVDAVAGTVTVSRFDANAFAGEFVLDLGGGDIIRGTFDVALEYDAYKPVR